MLIPSNRRCCLEKRSCGQIRERQSRLGAASHQTAEGEIAPQLPAVQKERKRKLWLQRRMEQE